MSHESTPVMRYTAMGTLTSVAGTIDSHDYAKTVVLAAIGALVSFLVGQILHHVKRIFQKKKKDGKSK